MLNNRYNFPFGFVFFRNILNPYVNILFLSSKPNPEHIFRKKEVSNYGYK